MEQQSIERAFYFNRKILSLYLYIAIFAGFCFILALFLIQRGGALGFAFVMSLVFYFLHKNKPLLTLFENHFELRLAPLAGLQIYKYSDLERIESDKKQILIFIAGEKKEVKIPLSNFSAEERGEIIQLLEEKLKNRGES